MAPAPPRNEYKFLIVTSQNIKSKLQFSNLLTFCLPCHTQVKFKCLLKSFVVANFLNICKSALQLCHYNHIYVIIA